MANAWYEKGAQRVLSKLIDFSSDDITFVLMADTYTPNLAVDEFLDDISAHALNSPQLLGSVTVTGGVLDGADINFAAVTTGDIAIGIAMYKDTGSGATSPLLAWFDSITGFPVTTNGADIPVQFDNGPSKIIKL